MSDRLRREIAIERELLNRLLVNHRELMERCAEREPDSVEISALAAMLHSFYTGLENAFKRVAVHLDRALPEGPAWHSRLLERMAEPTRQRRSVISQGLRDRLRPYMAFRHKFRHTYSFDLRWSQMKPLVVECEDVLRQAETELDEFLDCLNK